MILHEKVKIPPKTIPLRLVQVKHGAEAALRLNPPRSYCPSICCLLPRSKDPNCSSEFNLTSETRAIDMEFQLY